MKKKLTLLLLFFTLTGMIYAQAPNAIPYQGVVRNLDGSILASQNISLRLSIHDGSVIGPIVYQETHAVTTTTLGLFNVNIGQGTPFYGGSIGLFSAIDWGTGEKWLQVEMDTTGIANAWYVDMGTTQLNSVPYALYAERASNIVELDPEVASTTTNNIPKWNGSSLVDGIIFDNGTNVEIGGDALINGITVGKGGVGGWLNPHFANTAIGYQSLQTPPQAGTAGFNTAMGYQSLQNNIYGYNNTAIGYQSLQDNNNGYNNTAIGYEALKNNYGGYNNTAIGYGADISQTSIYNSTAIGSNALVTASNSMVLGNSNVKVGIGTTAPTEKLDVIGKTKTEEFQMTSNAGPGKILISMDAAGNAYWGAPTSQVGSVIPNKVPRWNGTALVDGIINDYGMGNYIGIGTSTQTNNSILNVQGQSYFKYSNYYLGPHDYDDYYAMIVDGSNHGIRIRAAVDKPHYSNGAVMSTGMNTDVNFIDFESADQHGMGRIEGFNPYTDWLGNCGTDLDCIICWLNEFFGPVPTDPVSIAALNTNLIVSQLCWMDYSQNGFYGGVAYATGSGDYAEYLERANLDEDITFASVLGVKGGKVSKNTEDAEQYLVVSLAPAVLGNMPPHDSLAYKYEKMAFLGQVPVKVKGKVDVGDYILPSGNNDGLGIGVHEEDLTIDQIGKIVGRSMQASENEYYGLVKVIVGLRGNELSSILKKMQDNLDHFKNELSGMNLQLTDQQLQINALVQQLNPKQNEATTAAAPVFNK